MCLSSQDCTSSVFLFLHSCFHLPAGSTLTLSFMWSTPHWFRACAYPNGLLMDWIEKSYPQSPTLYMAPSTVHRQIPKRSGGTIPSWGIYVGRLPDVLGRTSSSTFNRTLCTLVPLRGLLCMAWRVVITYPMKIIVVPTTTKTMTKVKSATSTTGRSGCAHWMLCDMNIAAFICAVLLTFHSKGTAFWLTMAFSTFSPVSNIHFQNCTAGTPVPLAKQNFCKN